MGFRRNLQEIDPTSHPDLFMTSGTAKKRRKKHLQKNGFEPSGLVIGGDKDLYLVSDNGKLAKLDLTQPKQGWIEQALQTPDGHNYGFESITSVENLLMLGIEGADKKKHHPYPMILSFDCHKNQRNKKLKIEESENRKIENRQYQIIKKSKNQKIEISKIENSKNRKIEKSKNRKIKN